jgi:hypothetical protein
MSQKDEAFVPLFKGDRDLIQQVATCVRACLRRKDTTPDGHLVRPERQESLELHMQNAKSAGF